MTSRGGIRRSAQNNMLQTRNLASNETQTVNCKSRESQRTVTLLSSSQQQNKPQGTPANGGLQGKASGLHGHIHALH